MKSLFKRNALFKFREIIANLTTEIRLAFVVQLLKPCDLSRYIDIMDNILIGEFLHTVYISTKSDGIFESLTEDINYRFYGLHQIRDSFAASTHNYSLFMAITAGNYIESSVKVIAKQNAVWVEVECMTDKRNIITRQLAHCETKIKKWTSRADLLIFAERYPSITMIEVTSVDDGTLCEIIKRWKSNGKMQHVVLVFNDSINLTLKKLIDKEKPKKMILKPKINYTFQGQWYQKNDSALKYFESINFYTVPLYTIPNLFKTINLLCLCICFLDLRKDQIEYVVTNFLEPIKAMKKLRHLSLVLLGISHNWNISDYLPKCLMSIYLVVSKRQKLRVTPNLKVVEVERVKLDFCMNSAELLNRKS
ncbi:hypothetical protein DAMA08_001290 [Martiniozyma asiatica (nom. inval.)]|nr:hypothetical protein DAMA08_001290 [Martiniozyma asiatica]